MSEAAKVLDRIDAVMAEEKCPHCKRDWHTKPLTRRIAAMFDQKHLNPGYFNGRDESAIVCEGSYLYGPRRPEPEAERGWVSLGYTNATVKFFSSDMKPLTGTLTMEPSTGSYTLEALWQLKAAAWDYATYTSKYVLGIDQASPWVIPHYTSSDWWNPEPEPLPECDLDVVVEFGPQHWLPSQEPVPLPYSLSQQVAARNGEFRKPDIPTPTPRDADFTAVVEKFNKQFEKKFTERKFT